MSDLVDLTAVEQRRLIGAKDVSATELLDAHLARIDAVNPAVNAIVALDPAVGRARARAVDDAISAGDDVGPGRRNGAKDDSAPGPGRVPWQLLGGSVTRTEHHERHPGHRAARRLGRALLARLTAPVEVVGGSGTPDPPTRAHQERLNSFRSPPSRLCGDGFPLPSACPSAWP